MLHQKMMKKKYIKPLIILEGLGMDNTLLAGTTIPSSDTDYTGGDGGNLAKPNTIETPDLWADDEEDGETNVKLK